MIEKLIIIDGIIQNKSIDEIPIVIDLIEPKGKSNVRTMQKLYSEDGCTVHDTGNRSASAGDEMHQQYFQNVENYDSAYVGAHVFVDHDSITQVCPLNEKMYHAGDGKYGPGNTTQWALEICVNKNIEKSHSNAKALLASYLLGYPDKKLSKHQDWSKKYCPRWILDHGGFDDFCNDVYSIVEANKIDPTQIPSTWAKESWEKGVAKGVDDGENPRQPVTSEMMMVYLDRLGLLD